MYQIKTPDESTHVLKVKYSSDEEGGMINIPFQLSGATSYFS